MRVFHAIIAAIWVTSACHPASRTASSAITVSPAALRVVTATFPDGSVRFSRATSATRLADGTIVVADGGDRLLRFFDSTGRQLRTAGGPGAGPGEFQGLRVIPRCIPDSLAVSDGASSRISIFSAEGNFARSFQQPHLMSQIVCAGGSFAGLLAPEAASPGQTLRSSLLFFNARGDSTGAIRDVPLGELRPMGKATQIALTRDALYLGSSDSGAVDRYDLAGKKTGIVSLDLSTHAPSDAEYEAAVDRAVAPFPASQRAATKIMLLKMPKPARAPAYGPITADVEGDLWVTTTRAGDSVSAFRVVSPSGELLANVSLPDDVSLMEVGRDYLLALVTGGDGEQRAVEYRVARGAGKAVRTDGVGGTGKAR